MRSPFGFRSTLSHLLLSVFFSCCALGQLPVPAARVSGAVEDGQRVTLKHQVHPLARASNDLGAVRDDLAMERMILLLRPSNEQQEALEQYLLDQQTPGSPSYHAWLTPQEFGEHFGASQLDIAAVTGWLSAKGFQVNGVGKNRRTIEFSGTAGQVKSAFQTEIHRFKVNGEEHYANATDPTVPAAISPVISGLLSLHNFRRKPMSRLLGRAGESDGKISPLLTGTTGTHALSPYDFAKIYNVLPLWTAGIDGTGQSIAIVGRTDFYHYDVDNFRSYFGLPANPVNMVYNGPNPGTVSNDEAIEAELDLEWSGAVAKNATINFVLSASTNSADGVDLSALYAVENNVAPIISVSFGLCEADMMQSGTDFYRQLWQQAAAQGISVMVASGDTGSAGCDAVNKSAVSGLAVNGIAATAYNVAVGGTEFNDITNPSTYWSTTNDTNHSSVLSYIPELAWNDSTTSTSGSTLWATGGGVSTVTATPSWQTGTGVPTVDPGTTAGHHRYVPDVSLNGSSHDGYLVCAAGLCGGGGFYLVGGTSASSPAFAGIMALVNQKTGAIQGNPNFHLYPLAKTQGVYHDITSGTNAVPCTTGSVNCVNGKTSGYSAATGYDLTTGWGSVDANALVNNWNSTSFAASTITATATPTTLQHGSPVTFNVTVSGGSGTPTGAVAAEATIGAVTQGFGTANLASGAATGTIPDLPGGTYNVFFRYGGDTTYASSTSAQIAFNVTPEPSTVSASAPASVELGTNYTISVSAKGQSAVGTPTGQVKLTQGSVELTTAPLDSNGSASMFVTYSPASGVGTLPFTISYAGDKSFSASSSTFNIAFTKATMTTYLNCLNYNGQAVVGTSLPCTVNLSSTYMPWGAITGTVQIYDNGTAIGSAVSLQGNWSTQITLNGLAVGTHSLTAQYSGDANHGSATSLAQSLTIVANGTVSTTLNLIPNLATPGSTVQVNVSVSKQQYGPGLAGTLQLLDGTTVLASSAVSGESNFAMFFINTPQAPLSKGVHPLTAAYTGDPLWTGVTSQPSPLAITDPDFSIVGQQSVIAIAAGGSVSTSVAIKSIAGMSGNVDLTCTGAPAESTCTVLSPAPIGSYSSVTIVTKKAVTSLSTTTAMLKYSAALLPMGFALLGFGVRSNRKRILLTLAIALCFLPMVACGGGSGSAAVPTPVVTDPGTPKGSYTLTVTGTYGSGATAITHSTTINLIVQ